MIIMTALFFGDRGSLVSMLQLALRRAGFLSGAADGIYGMLTRDAVMRLQTSFSLPTNGIADEPTWGALAPYLRGYAVYTVRENDSLPAIADRFGTRVNAVITANPGLDASSPTVGQRIIVPYSFDVVPENILYSYELVTYIVDGLTARYPFLASGSIGESVAGKKLYRLSLGTGDKSVFYFASIHANEWITVPVLLKYTERSCRAYAYGNETEKAAARAIFDRIVMNIVPLANPDGVDLVTGATVSGSLYDSARRIAQNYPSIPFPSGWKANIRGTDLNLQFPAEWEKARRIKYAQGFTSPAPRDYTGAYPLSAPESRALYDYTVENNFQLILAYHTQGNIIYPYLADYNPPFSREIAATLSRVSGYAIEETPPESANAGYKDWFIQTYNRPGYTIECGIGINPLPLSQFDRIYAANEPLLTAAITEILRLT